MPMVRALQKRLEQAIPRFEEAAEAAHEDIELHACVDRT
jgi:hypothetical protein